MKEICLLMVAVLLSSAHVYGGGGRERNLSVDDPAAKDLRIMIRNIGLASTNDNLINRELERRTGFKLNWDLRPANGYSEAAAAILASGDYPDAMEYWPTRFPYDLQDLADDKVLRTVDDLLVNYGTNFLDPVVRPADGWFVSAADGKRYAIPTRASEFSSESIIVIRKDWLDRLGLSIPKNSDEYFNVMTAFVENKEQLVGPGKRFVPLGAWQGSDVDLFNYFLSENGITGGWNLINGRYVHAINLEGHKNALLTMRRFYQAGLLEPEYPLINRDEALMRMIQDNYGSWTWGVNNIERTVGELGSALFIGNPGMEGNLAFIPFFPDRNGIPHYINDSYTMQMLIFTKTPEAKAINIVKLLNYMVSEDGFVLTQIGLEGFSYTRGTNGDLIGIPLSREEQVQLGFKTLGFAALRSFTSPINPKYVKDFVRNELSREHGVLMPVTVGDTWRENGSALNSTANEYKLRLVTEGNINFDAVYKEFVDTWNTQGGAKVTQEMNEYYGRN
jgi:putative aldouronate transport system substrate-binding protein